MNRVIELRPFDRPANSNGLASSLLATANPAILGSVTVHNTAGATRYVQVFDLAAVPSDWTTPPRFQVAIGANGYGGLDFVVGRRMANGIAIVISTADTGVTAPGGGECLIDCEYRADPS